MIKTSTRQTFCKMDSAKFILDANKSSKETNPCAVKNGELVQFGMLLQLTNSTETSKLSERKFTSMNGSVESLKNVADIRCSTDSKEIFETTPDDIPVDSATSNLPESNSHQTNVSSSESERTDSVLALPQTDFVPCLMNPEISHGKTDDILMDSETNENMKIKIEESCEMIDAIEFNNGKMATNSAVIYEMTDDLGISITITDVAGISSAYTDDTRNSIKTTAFTKMNCGMIDAIEISSEKADSAIMTSDDDTRCSASRNETTNIAMIPNETFVKKSISQLTESRRIDVKTTNSISKLDVKSANTSTETVSEEGYTSHNLQAKTIAKYKGKIPKTPKMVSKTFALRNESQQLVILNSETYTHAKAMTVDSYEKKNLAKQNYEPEKFLNAINLTNKDMAKKSGTLLQKEKLVAEVLSYVHAVQSIFRLSTPCLFSNDVPRNAMANNGVNKHFYEAGDYILSELKLYQSELKADFEDWESYRRQILDISERIPYDFELRGNKKSVRELMHGITTEICGILKNMEVISSKREHKNEECIDLMDGIDTYIQYSSAFVMGESNNVKSIFYQ